MFWKLQENLYLLDTEIFQIGQMGAEKIESEVFEKDISWTIWTQQGQIL